MQDPASELPRIPLLRTWVNKGKKRGPGLLAGVLQSPRHLIFLMGFQWTPKVALLRSKPQSLPWGKGRESYTLLSSPLKKGVWG